MDNGNGITKADLTEFKAQLTAELVGDSVVEFRDDITYRLRRMEANLIAAFRSYDV